MTKLVSLNIVLVKVAYLSVTLSENFNVLKYLLDAMTFFPLSSVCSLERLCV